MFLYLVLLSVSGHRLLAVQPPPPSTPAGLSEVVIVREVLVDALVTDRLGNVVPGLAQSDFVVKQNGRRVSVHSATYYDCLVPPSAAPAGASEVRPESRFFAILAYLTAEERARAGPILGKWVVEALQPWDYAMVGNLTSRLIAEQALTQDHAAVAAAIGRWNTSNGPGVPSSIERQSMLAPMPGGGMSPTALLANLSGLAEDLRHIQRRKNLLLLAGDDVSGQFREEELRRTIGDLNSNDTAVYVFDLGVDRPVRRALRRLARGTAGQFFAASADVAIALSNVVQQNRGYYLLSFAPRADPSGDDKRVTVTMRDSRFIVRALPRQSPN